MSTLKEKAEQILQEKEEKILAENIKKDVTIYNVTGSLQEGIDTSDATATGQDILSGKTAYVNGEKIEGYIDCPPSIMNYYPINYDYITITDESFLGETQWLTVDPIAVGRSTGNTIHQYITTDNNFYWKEMLGFRAVANVIGLTANKIKKNETILGITGTYEGDTPSYNDDVVGNLANINLYDSGKDGMWSLSSLRFSTDGYKYQFQEARIEPNANDEYPFDMENIDELALPKIIDFGYVYDSQSNIQPYIVMADFEYRIPPFDPEYRFDIELEFNLYKSYRGSQNLIFTSAFTGGIGLSQNFIVAYGDIDNHTPIMGSTSQDDYTSIVDVIIRKPV